VETVDAAREEEVLRPEPGSLDPLLDCISGRCCDLELHRPLCLVLHDRCAGGHLVAMADVSNFEPDEVTPTQLAVDPQIEEGEFANPMSTLR
jgi:hypothetical protein